MLASPSFDDVLSVSASSGLRDAWAILDRDGPYEFVLDPLGATVLAKFAKVDTFL